jgi:hypothetical protein
LRRHRAPDVGGSTDPAEEVAAAPRTLNTVEAQLRRYFLGLVGFGFVACWAAAGLVTGLLAVAACTAVVAGPQLLHRRTATARKRRAEPRRRPPVLARALADEEPLSLPLVPDEPSLILELG